MNHSFTGNGRRLVSKWSVAPGTASNGSDQWSNIATRWEKRLFNERLLPQTMLKFVVCNIFFLYVLSFTWKGPPALPSNPADLTLATADLAAITPALCSVHTLGRRNVVHLLKAESFRHWAVKLTKRCQTKKHLSNWNLSLRQISWHCSSCGQYEKKT